jgi:hypothetical protein
MPFQVFKAAVIVLEVIAIDIASYTTAATKKGTVALIRLATRYSPAPKRA